MVTLAVAMGAMGLTSPNAVALALAPFRERAGMAALLMGAVQFSVAAGTSFVLGHLGAGSALPLAIALVVGGLATQVTLKTLLTRR
jgi:DHA1 family bicyclomycin/chloramphenicol resistance-like MFS transporter